MTRKKDEEKLSLIISIIIIVVVAGALLGISAETIEKIVELLVSVFIGILLSMVAGSLVQAFTGNILKKILLPINIKGFKFSISVFVIVTFIVKVLLFGI